MCYRWNVGQQYFYRISCKAEIDDMLVESTGSTTYTVGAAPTVSERRGDSVGRPGSGTAFAVSSDGYLITCDHVVGNATDIKVTLGNRTTPCQVIARDSIHDVALIRTAREDLPVIPLADSEAVELAEEVRAVGFPLSDVLGSSIKITQGSIAGVVNKRRGKQFQIDAVVNPGNSGGPLVNDRGAVVGVVNAQLVGMQISKVGFAVPVNYAKAMLTRHQVKFQTVSGAKLDGPALAKRVTPAVGLVTMTCYGYDSAEDAVDGLTLSYHGCLDHRKQTKAAAATAKTPPKIDSSDRDDGRVVVDEYGDVSHLSGRMSLPCLLGSLGTVAIDALPTQGEKEWKRREMLTIHPSRQGPYDPLARLRPRGYDGPRMILPPSFGFYPHAEDLRWQFPAEQQVSYTMDAPKGKTVLIHKRVELKTLERAETGPKIELNGSGETLFDLKAGVPQKVTFSGTLVVREGGLTTKMPVSLVCERGDASEAPAVATKPAPANLPDMPSPVASPQNAETAKLRLDSFLASLRAADKDWSKCFQALSGLSMMKPIDSRRDEVADVLGKYLAESSYSARSSALQALRTWGTRRNVPALVRLLNSSENESLRRQAIELLGSLGDGQAAAALAQRLKDPTDRKLASQALQALGAAAEVPLIAMLAEQDQEVRAEVYRLLGEVGGAKSIAALKEPAAKDDAAKAALERLQAKQ